MRDHIGRILFASLSFLAAAVLLIMFYISSHAEGDARTYNVSVLVRAPSDRFMKGVEQAALDYNVDLHVLSSYAKNDGAQQIEYLKRELDSNADGVVLFAEDTAALEGYLDSLRSRPTVVTVGQRLRSGRAALHVGAHERLIGESLGRYIAGQTLGECLILCPYEQDAYHSERLEGLIQALVESSIRYSIRYCEPDTENIGAALHGNKASSIAVLDESLLIPACEEADESDALFGLGYVSGARPYLENGRLSGLIVYSEYDAGYLSLRAAVRAAEGQQEGDSLLTIYTATAKNMYSEPLVKILFPIG